MTLKSRKKSRNFMFLSAGCSLLRAEGFFCILDVLYGGLGIGKLQFLIFKKYNFFPAVNCFFNFWSSKPLDPDWIRIRIGIPPKLLDPDPYQMNTDPQPWKIVENTVLDFMYKVEFGSPLFHPVVVFILTYQSSYLDIYLTDMNHSFGLYQEGASPSHPLQQDRFSPPPSVDRPCAVQCPSLRGKSF